MDASRCRSRTLARPDPVPRRPSREGLQRSSAAGALVDQRVPEPFGSSRRQRYALGGQRKLECHWDSAGLADVDPSAARSRRRQRPVCLGVSESLRGADRPVKEGEHREILIQLVGAVGAYPAVDLLLCPAAVCAIPAGSIFPRDCLGLFWQWRPGLPRVNWEPESFALPLPFPSLRCHWSTSVSEITSRLSLTGSGCPVIYDANFSVARKRQVCLDTYVSKGWAG
jgi:hypothetical protein